MVNTLDDSGEGSLRQAVEVANATPGADVIRFAPGLSGSIELTSQLEISDDVRIRGPGQDVLTLSGGGATRVLLVTPNAEGVAPLVTISRLTVANGLATDAPGWPAETGFAFGGGLYNFGSVVELDQMSFIDNVGGTAATSIGGGGAIANENGGHLYVNRSSFDANEAIGLVAGGGAIYTGPEIGNPTAAGYTEIVATDFTDNHARSLVGAVSIPELDPFPGIALGGAVVNFASEMEISRSSFVSNTAVGGSGTLGLADSAVGGHASAGAVVSSNFSLSGLAPSSLMLSNSTFEANMAIGGNGAGANGGEAIGGAVLLNLGTEAVLRNNTFTDNLARGGNGDGAGSAGGLAAGGAVVVAGDSDASLIRNTYVANQSLGGNGAETGPDGLGRGGALGLYVYNIEGKDFGSPSADSRFEVFEGNQANGDGGGIFNFEAGTLSIRDAAISNNLVQATPKQLTTTYFQSVGAAAGGGIKNLGNLTVTRSDFVGNVVWGADDAIGNSFPGPSFAGSSFGGGIYNEGIAEISDSGFFENQVFAGDRGQGDFAATAAGGAVFNEGAMTIERSTFAANQAVAGDDSISLLHNGHALGGAIFSGSLMPAVDPTAVGASMVIVDSNVSDNEAIGGNNNVALAPIEFISLADGPNNAIGGGIAVIQGAVQIADSSVIGNSAVAGDGGASSNGSLAAGGGVFLFDFLGGVAANLTRMQVHSNSAVGGNGTESDPQGGQAFGGGIGVGSLGGPFGGGGQAMISNSSFGVNSAIGGRGFGLGDGGQAFGGAVANVGSPGGLMLLSDSRILRNRALGGNGGDLGGNGGNASGGGVYSGETAQTTLARDIIMANFAIGGQATNPLGVDGVGIGGGIYSEGILDLDEFTRRRTFFNRADIDDNIFA